MFTLLHFAVVFAVAFGVTALLVPLVRAFATKHGIVDKPGPRRVNRTPVPRLGGVAMFGGVLAAFIFEAILEFALGWQGPLISFQDSGVRAIGVLVGLAFVVAVGIFDDVYSMRPAVKFLGQLIAACIVAFSGALIVRFHIPFTAEVVALGPWVYPITVIYLVCFINIINLIDGLDGLAAGITAISAGTLLIIMTSLGNAYASFCAIVLIGICLGFLLYNFNPASIFMGDSGSMLLGLLLGTVSLLGAARFASVTTVLVPIVISLVPVIDTLGAIVRRIRGHKSISQPDSDHLHHRLLRRGFSQRKVVLLIYLWTALLSAGTLAIWEIGGAFKYAVLVIMLIASVLVAWKLGLFGPIRQRHGRRDITYDTEGVDPVRGDRDEG